MSYTQHTKEQVKKILERTGAKRVDDFFVQIPQKFRKKFSVVGEGMPEVRVYQHMAQLLWKNRMSRCITGGGRYDHYIPALVDELAHRGEFYTSYTPYQPEASQGTLQAIFEYQTMMCELTGLDVSNASHYDGATALAEAVGMSIQQTGKRRVLYARSVNPLAMEVVKTYLREKSVNFEPLQFNDAGQVELQEIEKKINGDIACVVVQNPNFFGVIEDIALIARAARKANAVPIAMVNPISLGVLKPPGECGYEIACGDGQPLGIPLQLGGPSFGFLCCSNKFLRLMPGRLVGKTVDKEGKPAYCLTLQTREQHIRREKATSNICTNQSLMALRAAIYISSIGKQGIARIGEYCIKAAYYLAQQLEQNGVCKRFLGPSFNEIVICPNEPLQDLNKRLAENGFSQIIPIKRWYPEFENCGLIAVTEKLTVQDIDNLVEIITGAI